MRPCSLIHADLFAGTAVRGTSGRSRRCAPLGRRRHPFQQQCAALTACSTTSVRWAQLGSLRIRIALQVPELQPWETQLYEANLWIRLGGRHALMDRLTAPIERFLSLLPHSMLLAATVVSADVADGHRRSRSYNEDRNFSSSVIHYDMNHQMMSALQLAPAA